MMDADDTIAQQQQQQLLEQQRRQQEQLRRQQDERLRDEEAQKQIIEDEERERLKEGKSEEVEGAFKQPAAPNSTRRWRLFGKKSDDTMDVPDQHGNAGDSGVVTGPVSNAGSGSTSVWIVGTLALCLAGFLGYRYFMPSDKPKTAKVAPPPKVTALPTAEPGTGLSDPQGPRIDINGDPVPATAAASAAVNAAVASVTPASAASAHAPAEPVAQAPASVPVAGNAMADPVEMAAAAVAPAPVTPGSAAAASTELLALHKLDSARREPSPAPEMSAPAQAAPTPVTPAAAPDLAALEARIRTLEEQIKTLRAGHATATAKQTNTAAKQSKPARRQVASDTRQAARSDRPAPKAPAQLLAVDLWDGRPSVVIGTGARGDKRTRVLQPGESFNGIALQSVDVGNQRATFSTGTGTVTMEVK